MGWGMKVKAAAPRAAVYEDDVQASIKAWLDAVLWPHGPDEAFVYANPNGSRRTPGGKASNGVPGLTRGIPDLTIIATRGRAFYFEVKRPKGGVLSDFQKAILQRFARMGVPFAVVRSVDEARHALAAWGLPIREAA